MGRVFTKYHSLIRLVVTLYYTSKYYWILVRIGIFCLSPYKFTRKKYAFSCPFISITLNSKRVKNNRFGFFYFLFYLFYTFTQYFWIPVTIYVVIVVFSFVTLWHRNF